MKRYDLNQLNLDISNKLDKLTSPIHISDKISIRNAVEDAKLYKNQWNRVGDAVVVFSDLKNSTGISFDKQKKTMSKLLEFLNYPFIEIHNKFGAEFIDIKGDGGIAIYSSQNYLKAIIASITVKTFYYKNIINKVKQDYDFDFIVETGIANGDLLVKRVGTKSDDGSNDFYVWAGETVNMAALISKLLKQNKSQSNNIGLTQDLYNRLEKLKCRDYILRSCGCGDNLIKSDLWKGESLPNGNGKRYFYLNNNWCDTHGQPYLYQIISEE